MEAKNIVWDQCSKDLAAKPNRRDTNTHSAIEVHMLDIMEALSKVDELGKSPRILIDAKMLSMIVKLTPGEMNPISMADRVNRLEIQYSTMSTNLDNRGSYKANLRSNMVLKVPRSQVSIFFIYLVDPTTNIEDLKSLLDNQEQSFTIRDLELEKTWHYETKSRSFKNQMPNKHMPHQSIAGI